MRVFSDLQMICKASSAPRIVLLGDKAFNSFLIKYFHIIRLTFLWLQVQKWAPTADNKLNLQILIGFGSANVGIQWNGPQAEAEAALQSSGILSVPSIQARHSSNSCCLYQNVENTYCTPRSIKSIDAILRQMEFVLHD